MQRFEWDNSLSLGDAMIDQQHKSIMELANQVIKLSETPGGEEEIMHTITSMFLYAREHFFDEEGLMERLGYPEREQHALLHKDFVEKTSALADACLNGSMAYCDLTEFLIAWIKEHVGEEDQNIARFIMGKARA